MKTYLIIAAVILAAAAAWAADLKVSQLPLATVPTGAVIPVLQGGVTKQLPAYTLASQARYANLSTQHSILRAAVRAAGITVP